MIKPYTKWAINSMRYCKFKIQEHSQTTSAVQPHGPHVRKKFSGHAYHQAVDHIIKIGTTQLATFNKALGHTMDFESSNGRWLPTSMCITSIPN